MVLSCFFCCYEIKKSGFCPVFMRFLSPVRQVLLKIFHTVMTVQASFSMPALLFLFLLKGIDKFHLSAALIHHLHNIQSSSVGNINTLHKALPDLG